MTNEELRVHANNQCVHWAKVRDALNAKAKNAKELAENGLSTETSTEIIAVHDAIILSLSTPKSDTNPNGIPSEQDAIDSLVPAPEEEAPV